MDGYLTVKELADEMGVTPHYVYLMRACGFPMDWRCLAGYGGRKVLAATLAEALEWREANEFRFIHGLPVVTRGQLRFGLQLDWVTGGGNMVRIGKSLMQKVF